MITESDIYWLTRMDSLKALLAAFVFIFGFSSFISLMIWFVNYEADEEKWGNDKYLKSCAKSEVRARKTAIVVFFFVLPMAIICGISHALVPTTNEMAAIKVIPKIANSEDLQGLGKDTVDLARDWLKELKPKKTAEKQ